jgi:hypothetical protein
LFTVSVLGLTGDHKVCPDVVDFSHLPALAAIPGSCRATSVSSPSVLVLLPPWETKAPGVTAGRCGALRVQRTGEHALELVAPA